MATKKEETTKSVPDKKETPVKTGVPESTELTAIAVKSLTNLEEKVDAIDWKLWEIYNIVKNYVESEPVSAPTVSQPQASAADIASEIAKSLGEKPTEKKSVVGKLFGK
jgi:hypothetical protein